MQNISVTISSHPQHKDITLLTVKGSVDTTTADEFERAFQSVLGEKKYNIIIDLKEVTYISSVGWGIFIGEIKRIRGQKGNLFFVSMSPNVEEAYELLQFNTIFKAFTSVDLAVQNGFARALAGKAAAKPRLGGNFAEPQAAKSVEKAPVSQGFEAPRMGQAPKKLGWFTRLLTPWNWF